MKYKIIFANLIFVLAMFPYISVFHLPFDIQPWALIVASLFSLSLLYEDKFHLPTPLKIITFFAFYALISFVYLIIKKDADIILGVRSLAGYFSVLVFTFIAYKTFLYLKTEYFIGSIGIWLVAAFAQLLFGAMVLSSFLSRISTGGPRGFTSLAPEPSFYAAICVSFLILNEFFYLNKKYGIRVYISLFIVLLLQIIFSYSGVGMMLLILFAGSKLLEILFIKEESKKKWLALGTIILIVFSIILFFNNKLLGEKRAGSVLKQSITDPVDLVKNDYSVSNRLMNPVVGVYGGIVETKGIGFGVGSKESGPVPLWLSKLRGIETMFGGKIEGGLISSVYELGFIGFAFIFTILWIVGMSIWRNVNMRPALIASAFSLFIPMCIWGSLSVPLFGYILGIHMYYLYNIE